MIPSTRNAGDLYYTSNAGFRPIIATAASSKLRDVLSTDKWDPEFQWGRMSRLARDTIESQLESHAAYVTGQSAHARVRVPSLVDITAAMIPMGCSADDLAIIPPHILDKLSYRSMCCVLTSLSLNSKGPPSKRQKVEFGTKSPLDGGFDIDEWIVSHEKNLGNAGDWGNEWWHGLVNLADAGAVFPNSTATDLGRTITRLKSLPGYAILGGERQPEIHTQPSLAAFKSRFDKMSDGLLKNLDWTNIFVAGGFVLGALLAVKAPTHKPQPADQWKSSDIDMYVYGLTPTEANEKIKHIFNTFRANLPKGMPALVVRNSKTITMYSEYPLRRIQIVLKLVKSPKGVLLNFDLDICAMGYDGSEFWMLPRAARALETGYNVFTMNLIQGHYLSQRRATQEERVFKYAYKGYGIRILPSYLDSLEESNEKLDEISRGEDLFDLNVNDIADASRRWTATVIRGVENWKSYPANLEFSHRDLENESQVSSEPQSRSCLSGFSLFMRHVALWEMERRKEVIIKDRIWASSTYDEDQGNLAYDDTPDFTWDENFSIPKFKSSIDQFNLRQITNWLETANDGILHDIGLTGDPYDGDGGPLKDAARISYASDLDRVLEKDITLPILLPLNFVAFVNDIVGKAQAAAGLTVESILTPVNETSTTELSVSPESNNATLRLFIWRIGKELMWQQLDRRIDEVSEALYAFHRIHDRMNRGNGQWETQLRLVTQLSKRAISPIVEDEFDAFARWIGRKPVFINKFFNQKVNFETIV